MQRYLREIRDWKYWNSKEAGSTVVLSHVHDITIIESKKARQNRWNRQSPYESHDSSTDIKISQGQGLEIVSYYFSTYTGVVEKSFLFT